MIMITITDYRLQSSNDNNYRFFAVSCKYTRCNQSKYMFFHASFHKFTQADASTGDIVPCTTCKGYCNCCNHF